MAPRATASPRQARLGPHQKPSPRQARLGPHQKPSPRQAPRGKVFQETVVRVASDGTPRVFTRPITLEQELADNAARQEERASGAAARSRIHVETAIDSACNAADMWLYDAANGTGNRICVSGTGFQDLKSTVFHCRIGFCELAAGHVRSFWPGSDQGYFEQEGGSYCTQYFSSWGPLTNADSCGVTTNLLALGLIIQ